MEEPGNYVLSEVRQDFYDENPCVSFLFENTTLTEIYEKIARIDDKSYVIDYVEDGWCSKYGFSDYIITEILKMEWPNDFYKKWDHDIDGGIDIFREILTPSIVRRVIFTYGRKPKGDFYYMLIKYDENGCGRVVNKTT